MIDFEREIEIRLSQFQLLNGKGNVKDCNNILYEIIHLMLEMIQVNKPLDDDGEPDESSVGNGCDPTPANQYQAFADAEPNEPNEVSIPAPVKTIYAPLGLTRFGNPIRDRSRHTKRGPNHAPTSSV